MVHVMDLSYQLLNPWPAADFQLAYPGKKCAPRLQDSWHAQPWPQRLLACGCHGMVAMCREHGHVMTVFGWLQIPV